MNRAKENTAMGMSIGLVIVILLAILLICPFCNYYTINFWLDYAGSAKDFPFWGAILLSFVPGMGQIAVPGAAITWVVSFFL